MPAEGAIIAALIIVSIITSLTSCSVYFLTLLLVEITSENSISAPFGGSCLFGSHSELVVSKRESGQGADLNHKNRPFGLSPSYLL